MTIVGDLTVLLDANTSGLRKGLGRLRGALSGVGGLVAGLAGGAGLGALVTKGLEAADALGKMRDRTGASVEFLSALRNGASQSDVSFERVGKSLARLNRSFGELADGTKAQEEAFGSLGISLEDVADLNVDERFKLVAERLAGINDEAEKARIGNDIFGRSFEDLRPLLKNGAKGLEEFQRQAEESGQILNTDGVDASSAALDKMQELKNAAAGLGTTFATKLAPQITKALGVLQDSLPAILDFASASFTFIGKGVDAIGTSIGGIAAAAGAAFDGNFSGAGSILGDLVNDVSAIITGDDGEQLAEQQRTNALLGEVARNTRNPAGAVAG